MKQVGDSAREAAAKAGKIRDEIAVADTAAEASNESYIYRKYKIIKLFENLKK